MWLLHETSQSQQKGIRALMDTVAELMANQGKQINFLIFILIDYFIALYVRFILN